MSHGLGDLTWLLRTSLACVECLTSLYVKGAVARAFAGIAKVGPPSHFPLGPTATALVAPDEREGAMALHVFMVQARRYIIGVLAVVIAVALTHVIWPQPAIPNKTLLIAAVMATAFYCGLGPALLATGLAASALVFVILPPRYEFSLGAENVMNVVLFLLISILAGTLHAVAKRETAAAVRNREAAEAANAAQARFLAMVSHELRTPLSPVVMMAQILENDPRLPGDAREDLAVVRRNAETLAHLVDDLMDAVRCGTGKLNIQRSNLGVHDLVRSVVAICRDDIRGKQLWLRVELRAEADHVSADPVRLQQVLWNLLRNAIKFTPEGGGITVRTSNDANGRLAIEVIDTGIGIEGYGGKDVFAPFEQGGDHVTMRYGGLGLGLTIAKLLTEAQGGTIELRSAGPGQGATARILLPVVFRTADEEAGTDDRLKPDLAGQRATSDSRA